MSSTRITRCLDELLSNREMDPEQARSHLAQYLFRGDDVFKPVSALSGGERGRLALAILALRGANFLLLDEPTNHLDLPAQRSAPASAAGISRERSCSSRTTAT